MHLIYIDESADPGLHIFSALAIPADQWKNAFQQVRNFRRELRKSDGIFVHKEFHAWEFVSGRGHLGDEVVPNSPLKKSDCPVAQPPPAVQNLKAGLLPLVSRPRAAEPHFQRAASVVLQN